MRLGFNILVTCALFFAPAWSFFLILFIGLFLFPRPVEFVVYTIIFDLLYRTQEIPPFGIMLPLGVYALIMYFVVEWIRGRLRERRLI